MDEIVGDGIPHSAWAHPSDERIAPVYFGRRKATLYREPLAPMGTLMVRPRGSAVGVPIKGMFNTRTPANMRPMSSGNSAPVAAKLLALGNDDDTVATVRRLGFWCQL